MSTIPTSPTLVPDDDPSDMTEGERVASGDAEQATRPFEQAPAVEDEQVRGNAPLDPDREPPDPRPGAGHRRPGTESWATDAPGPRRPGPPTHRS